MLSRTSDFLVVLQLALCASMLCGCCKRGGYRIEGGALARTALPLRTLKAARCQEKWHATVCGTEMFVGPLEEVATVWAGANQESFRLVTTPLTETVDVTLTGRLVSGEGAAALLLNLFRLTQDLTNQENGRLAEILFACVLVEPSECNQYLSEFFGDLDEEKLTEASAWYEGCERKDSTINQRINDLHGNRAGYALIARAKDDSLAHVSMTVTHQTDTQQSARVCLRPQSGSLPEGRYEHGLVGTINTTIPPRHGGSVEDVEVSVSSLIADGQFSVEQGQVFFTGEASKRHCPAHWILTTTERCNDLCMGGCSNTCPQGRRCPSNPSGLVCAPIGGTCWNISGTKAEIYQCKKPGGGAPPPPPPPAARRWRFDGRERCQDLCSGGCSGTCPPGRRCPTSPAGKACDPAGDVCWSVVGNATDMYLCR